MNRLAVTVIVMLMLAVGTLGYLYYEQRQENVMLRIQLPNISLEKGSLSG